jgi:hypothetical protein
MSEKIRNKIEAKDICINALLKDQKLASIIFNGISLAGKTY